MLERVWSRAGEGGTYQHKTDDNGETGYLDGRLN